MVGRQNADIADTLHPRDVAMTTIFLAFYIWRAHWRHLANTAQLSMCGGDAALCQITLTTCQYYKCTDYTDALATMLHVHLTVLKVTCTVNK